jgi:hypothetical protein
LSDDITGRSKLSLPGLYRGEIVNRDDPLRVGRCKVKVYQVYRDIPENDIPWAWPCFPGAGNKDSGFYDVPPLKTTVWVMFEMGDPDHPVWLGGWWGAPNGESEVPEEVGTHFAPDNLNRIWKSPTGHKIELDDSNATTGLRISDKFGNHIYLNTAKKVLEVYMHGDMSVIVTGDADVTINGSANVKIGGSCDINSDGPMQLTAPMIDLN